MTVHRYSSKPVEIEAMAIDSEFAKIQAVTWIRENGGRAAIDADSQLFIETLEGTMRAKLGDYIIRGLEGEFYPCIVSVFSAKYEIIP